MPEKKSKKLFSEDLTVFQEPQQPKKPVRKRSARTKSAHELEGLIKNLQSLGFKITPPSSQEDVQRQEASAEKLGFVDAQKKSKKAATAVPATVTIQLGTRHMISGQTFGPGDVVLSEDQSDLARTLLHQEQLWRQGHFFDTAQYQPMARCFLIRPGRNQNQHGKYSKIECSEAQLTQGFGDADPVNATVTSGQFDIAGYNPQFNAENSRF